MADAAPPNRKSHPSVLDWRDFLVNYPPGTRASVECALEPSDRKVTAPEIRLFCDGTCCELAYCKGTVKDWRKYLFPSSMPDNETDALLYYDCAKCNTGIKTYAVRIYGDASQLHLRYVEAVKLGEWPRFSFDTPARVCGLIGPDRDLFFKGRQAECDGLGVGAFAYYRRIVEDQKNRLLREIVTVAQRTGAPADSIAKLQAAIAETQFSKAVHMVKDAVPQSLLIKGHNPLTLLHGALSRDLHSATDEDCLSAASSIRLVLFELAERLAAALKDKRELDEALTRLLNN
ncbi:MAG: hypothetical protein U0791_26825 [Gemmataceae bacterium]